MRVVIRAETSGVTNVAIRGWSLRRNAEISGKSKSSQWLWSLGMLVAGHVHRTGLPIGVPSIRRAMKVNPFQPNQESAMNWDVIEGNWKQAKGKIKQQWRSLTDDRLDVVFGKRDQLVGQIQERYGIARDEAERQVSDWEAQHTEMFDAVMHRPRKKGNASRH